MAINPESENLPLQNSRAPFEQLGFTDAPADVIHGSDDADALRGDAAPAAGPGLPGALAFWTFAGGGSGGEFDDARGGPGASVFRLVDHAAVPQPVAPVRTGPDGTANAALEFNGEDAFAFIAHDPAMEVTQGTVSLWVQPDELSSGKQIILSKDQSGAGDGGHFRLGHEDDGRIFVRFAEGDGGSNKAWISSKAYLAEGQWTHLSVSFTADGITVYADGVAVPDYGWYRQEGNLDSPAQATEAYLLQNTEPWFLGTDTSGVHVNEDPDAFAAAEGELDDAFDGAIADFGLWGGFTPDAALNAAQVWQLFSDGPGTALTAPSGPQPILAGDDFIDGGAGNDTLDGDGGNDEIRGGDGHDSLIGDYGDDVLDGGNGNDVLEGGRGSDLLLGGDGDDLLVSRSDAGEQRIGQLATGKPGRGDPDNEVNPERQKLYGWEDQPLVGDDVLVGGAGNDTFLFNPQSNAKRDIILEHVNDDRSIDWAGVAGENNELHDHWPDSFGIDIIADYRAGEDTIAIVGHTVDPVVDHKLIDTDGDGIGDEVVSVITVYSDQGNNGGAHDGDLLGQIVVHGDLVDADDLVVEAGVTHGIVDTVDDIQEALAPSGDSKLSVLSNGETFRGYDTRDAEGGLGEIVANPERFSDNPFLDSGRFELAGNVPEGVPAPVAVIDEASHPELDQMTFTGNGEDGEGAPGTPGAYVNVAHAGRAAGLAQTSGTIAFSFVANSPGQGKQVLFSKDAGGYVDGGHLTAWIDDHGCLGARYQSTDQSVYFKADDVDVVAGQSYHVAFSFDGTRAELYVDGSLADGEDLSGNPAFLAGMSGNTESLVFGASTMHRTSGELNHLKNFFDGTIDDVVVADRALYAVEIFKLVEADGDFSTIGLNSMHPVNTPPDAGLPVGEIPTEPAASTSVVTPFTETDGTAGADVLDGGDGNDVINGLAGDDVIRGGDGYDTLNGGYGNDKLEGGDGNDILDGGRGSDLLLGGAGDDLLIGRSDSGEQRIGQLAIGEPTRPDPDNEVNPLRQKLYGWENQPLVGDDVLVGGGGRDTFLIAPQINAKLDIIGKHVREDGTIKWSRVAHENDELHDHWVDSAGIDIIADYHAAEDHIAIIGHTANIEVEHRDVDGDGDDESIITVYSNQGGGGGAHTEDLIAQVVVFGDKVDAEDVVTDAGVTYGIVENIANVEEAINPTGDLKTSTGPGGDQILGYDTRDAEGGLGPIVANPYEYTDNPFLGEVAFGAPTEPGFNNSRASFEPLGFRAAAGEVHVGGDGDDVIAGDPVPAPGNDLPGALAFWTFANGIDGLFGNERGGPAAAAYRLYENQSLRQVEMPLRAGPDGTANAALEFNGEDAFAFIAHDPAMEVTQGTVSLWVQPDELSSGQQIILSKDQKNAGDGGHFRLGTEDDGRIFVRFAEGDGGSNKAWISSKAYLAEGQWTHLSVSFTADGITVYADGVAVPDYGWYRQEGNLDSPAQATEAYLLQNQEPWILGADTSHTRHNDTAAEFATDHDHLDDAFDGAIADFGLWGGFTPDAALNAAQVWQLFSDGPGTALTAPSGPQPILAGDDFIDGGAGNDTLDGDGGNDEIRGGDGHDSLIGDYGDDVLDGGNGNDVLEGGRGSDLLLGGDGDDLLVSRSDAGEQRIGQLATGKPGRGDPDNEVNPERQKLYGWEDQPLVGDDVLVGGAGNDTFLFNPQINAKRDIILEHVNDDRSIDWAGVAGENNELHDHWPDSFGIDIIADYRAGEDTIAIVGHTVDPVVDHKLIDTDGDGIGDEVVSVITVYSDQGNNGGAHDGDLLGQIVVHGDLVDADDLVVEAGVTHGIVDTVDDIQEALAPSGDSKLSVLSNGETFRGYDTRDAEGGLGEIVANPERFSDNPFLDSGRFELAGNVPEGVPAPVAVIDEASHPELDQMTFTGNGEDGEGAPGTPGAYVNVAHAGRAAGLAQTSGTIAFSFVANSPGQGKQVLFSKDAGGYVDGGHLTAWIDDHGCLGARYQSTDQSVYFKADDVDVVAGQSYHVAFSFDGTRAELYVDGSLADGEDLSGNPAFLAGMSGNTESLVFGASTMHRTSGELNHLKNFFDGTIDDVVALDRRLYGAEALKLANGLLDIVATGPTPPPAEEPPVEEPPAEEPPVEEPPAEPPVDDDRAIVGTRRADELHGGTGNDSIVALNGNDTVFGNAGDDSIRAGQGNDAVDAGDGDDLVSGAGGRDAIGGGNGDDVIDGGAGHDALDGGDGDDLLNGGQGSDTIDGGAGNDTITGGNGSDRATGGDGDDLLIGGNGRDLLDGGNGDDELVGGNGRDLLNGGAGNDLVIGGRGKDTLQAGDGDDEAAGGQGSDLIAGGDGNDVIDGGFGRDILIGGAGDDDLTGGRGRDVFIYDSAAGPSLGFDVLRDFRSGQDALHVSEDLTLLFEQTPEATRITLRDAGENLVGTVDVLGDSFDAEKDIVNIAAGSSGDLFA